MTRTGALVAVVIAAAVSATATWIVAASFRSPADIAADADPPEPSPIAVPVERREIRDDLVARGVVAYADETAIGIPAVTPVGDRAIVTDLPDVGDLVEEGDVVASVSDRPILVFGGEFPLFGDLRPGDVGSDVQQLLDALVRLGLLDSTGETFDAAAREALDQVFRRHDASPPSDAVPVDEIVFLPDLPRRVVRVTAKLGDSGPIDAAVTVASGAMTVELVVDRRNADLLAVGDSATVEVTRLGVAADAQVVAIGPAEFGAAGANDRRVVVALDADAAPELAGESARVTVPIAARASAGEVLTVPSAALSTSVDGRVTVEVLTGDERRIVEVVVGRSNRSGLVEVSAPDGGLAAGDLVVVGFGVDRPAAGDSDD